MIGKIPHLHQFSCLYWNEMGSDVYGNIGEAFREFLRDCRKLPDGGDDILRSVYGELMSISESASYAQWVEKAIEDIPSIKAMGGRFIWPEDARLLLGILNREHKKRDS